MERYNVNDEIKKKISEAVVNSYKKTGRKPWNYGIPMSDKQKKAISQANTGRKITDEARKKLSDSTTK